MGWQLPAVSCHTYNAEGRLSQQLVISGEEYLCNLPKNIPITWFEKVCVKGTSSNLEAADEPGTNLGEMFCYLGLKVLMATMVGYI